MDYDVLLCYGRSSKDMVCSLYSEINVLVLLRFLRLQKECYILCFTPQFRLFHLRGISLRRRLFVGSVFFTKKHHCSFLWIQRVLKIVFFHNFDHSTCKRDISILRQLLLFLAKKKHHYRFLWLQKEWVKFGFTSLYRLFHLRVISIRHQV